MKIFKYIFILQLFILNLFANVTVSLEDSFFKNEPYIFTIEVSGKEIKTPDLSIIDSNIQEISSSISTNIINSKISKSIKKSYSFYPNSDFIFPSLKFVIDGKEYKTQEKKVVLKEITQTKSDDFSLDISINKNEVFVGENFILTLTFKFKIDKQIVGLSLAKPDFKDFWYKQLDGQKEYEKNDFKFIEINFLMTPLKEGNLVINPLLIQLQLLEENLRSFFSSTQVLKIYSNKLDLEIKKLPDNVELIGDFDISSSIGKQTINQGEAISYKLKISGIGNIDDIPDIKLPIENATIYENKPEIKTEVKDGNYSGVYEKVFSIIPNKSLVIPSIKLEYFDKNKEEIIIKQTDSFEIKVLEVKKQKEVFLEKQVDIQDKNSSSNETIKVVEINSVTDRILFFTLGVIVSVLIISLYFYVITSRRKKEELKPLSKKVKESKTKDELIKILAIYIKKDPKLDELIFKVEKDEDFKTLKKEIIKILKELNL